MLRRSSLLLPPAKIQILLPSWPNSLSRNRLNEQSRKMTLQFPNISRSFDSTRGCVRFSGYDHTREILFFVEENAIRAVDGGVLTNSEALLSAFDRHRERICYAANRAYGRRREGSYMLKSSDF